MYNTVNELFSIDDFDSILQAIDDKNLVTSFTKNYTEVTQIIASQRRLKNDYLNLTKQQESFADINSNLTYGQHLADSPEHEKVAFLTVSLII